MLTDVAAGFKFKKVAQDGSCTQVERHVLQSLLIMAGTGNDQLCTESCPKSHRNKLMRPSSDLSLARRLAVLAPILIIW